MSDWSFEWSAPAGERIAGRQIGVVVYPDDHNCTWWWSHSLGKWLSSVEVHERRLDAEIYPLGNTAPVKSFRAFKRHLRRHCQWAALGDEIVLVGRYVGHQVTARKLKDPTP